MKTKHTVGLVAILSVILAVCGWAQDSALKTNGTVLPAPNYPTRDFSDAEVWDVVRVLASDTVIIRRAERQLTVKLLGVSGPYKGPAGIEPLSYQSSALLFLTNLLAGEKVHVLSPPGPIAGTEMPTTARLFRVPDGLYVNLEMIRQGYSHLSPADLGPDVKLFTAYRDRAKASGKGLWTKLPDKTDAPSNVTVYVTKAGKRYHQSDCRFLAKSRIPIGLDQAKKRGYTPCRLCKPPTN